MTEATLTWSTWQSLLHAFAHSFTRRGFRRFAEWITAMALNVEEHTITQSVLALEQPAAWKALETFAEYGGWHEGRVTYDLTRLIATAPGRIWHGYIASAVDDTKVHRCSPHVWGTCTFHEYTARCPNRAGTVRAHNWVVLGALLHEPAKPGWFLPISGRLYFRESQLPAGPGGPLRSGPSASWPSSCSASRRGSPPASTWASSTAAMPCGASCGRWSSPRRRAGASTSSPGCGTTPGSMPCPADGPPRREAAGPSRSGAGGWTRPAAAAGGSGGGRPAPPSSTAGSGRSAGRRSSACGGCWARRCRSRRSSPQVEGYKKRFTLVTSAVELTGLQMVELFAARFRQEDGFRDLKQRLGWEECRAWTGNPIERTSQAQWVTMSLLRLLQFRLEAAGEEDWWFRPPWDKDKDRPSVLDAERLMRRHRAEIQRLLSEWLGDEGKTEEAVA